MDLQDTPRIMTSFGRRTFSHNHHHLFIGRHQKLQRHLHPIKEISINHDYILKTHFLLMKTHCFPSCDCHMVSQSHSSSPSPPPLLPTLVRIQSKYKTSRRHLRSSYKGVLSSIFDSDRVRVMGVLSSIASGTVPI